MNKDKCKEPKFRVGQKVEIIASDDFPELIEDDPALLSWVSYEDEGGESMHALYKTTSRVIQIAELLDEKGNTVYAYFLDNNFWWNEHWLAPACQSYVSKYLNELV